MLFSGKLIAVAVAGLWLVPAVLTARDITDVDYSRQAWSGGDTFSTQQKRFPVNENLSSQRFDVKDWHARFSGLGRKRANVNMTAREPEVVSHETLSFDRKERTMSRFDGRQAYVRNQGEVRRVSEAETHEDAAIRRFEGPMREVRSGLSDRGEVSMEDLNRFFYMRNKPGADTSGEVPVNRAGPGN